MNSIKNSFTQCLPPLKELSHKNAIRFTRIERRIIEASIDQGSLVDSFGWNVLENIEDRMHFVRRMIISRDFNTTPRVKMILKRRMEQIHEFVLKNIKTIDDIFTKKSSHPDVIAIEQRLLSQGVKSNFADNYETAKRVEKGIAEIIQAGFMPPAEVRVTSLLPQKVLGSALRVGPREKRNEIILLNQNDQIIGENTELPGFSSTNNPNQTLFHEFGHILLQDHSDLDPPALTRTDFAILEKEVSGYAAHNQNVREAGPEIFAGLMDGKKYSDEVMKIYIEKLNGQIPQVLPRIS